MEYIVIPIYHTAPDEEGLKHLDEDSIREEFETKLLIAEVTLNQNDE